MPQVDKLTFFPIALFTFEIYVLGFLLLSSSALYTFLMSLKATPTYASRVALESSARLYTVSSGISRGQALWV